VDVVQVIYNIFDQAPKTAFPHLQELDIGVIAECTRRGQSRGQDDAETIFPKNDWRSGYFSPDNLRQTLAHVDKLRAVLPRT